MGKAEGGRRKVEGGRRKVEGGRWKAEGGMGKAEGGMGKVECGSSDHLFDAGHEQGVNHGGGGVVSGRESVVGV